MNNVEVGLNDLEDLLGVKRFRYGLAEQADAVGVVTGLAWTSVGGDLLSIEALKLTWERTNENYWNTRGRDEREYRCCFIV